MKIFPIKLSQELWAALRIKAIQSGKSLHQFILDALDALVTK